MFLEEVFRLALRYAEACGVLLCERRMLLRAERLTEQTSLEQPAVDKSLRQQPKRCVGVSLPGLDGGQYIRVVQQGVLRECIAVLGELLAGHVLVEEVVQCRCAEQLHAIACQLLGASQDLDQ